MKKLKVLTFVGFYLPGYKAGGPLRTIANMVEHLSGDIEFWLVTRDRDLGDLEPYSGIERDTWCKLGKAHVYYCSPEHVSFMDIANIITDTNHDVLYLNSFFDIQFTVQPLIARYIKKIPVNPIVVASRGEFSEGALQLKKYRKIIYIFFTKMLGLYKNITWQASSQHEKKDILRILGTNTSVREALDLPSPVPDDIGFIKQEATSTLKIIFLSRISPMKNLDFSLRVLADVSSEVIFDIYGPKEDVQYWEECEELILNLPKNIVVRYKGAVIAKEVATTFAKYDLFLFPSRGENYGHVIAESLSVGTSVLISDKTPWKDLKEVGYGWDVPLSDKDVFSTTIEQFADKSYDERSVVRKKIKKTITSRLTNPVVMKANLELFYGLES